METSYQLHGALSLQQVLHFRQNGYLLLPEAISKDLVGSLRRTLLLAADARREPVRTNPSGKVTHVEEVVQRFDEILEMVGSQRVRGALESLLGPNIFLTVNRHNHATINLRGAQQQTRLHRDILQWSRSVVTAVFYLDDSTIENGCTHMVPGSHRLPFAGMPNNGGTWMDEYDLYNELIDQELPVPAAAGSVLLFDSLMFHRVSRNTTDGSRISVTLGFHSVDELSSGFDESEKLLVAGNNIYRGNDVGRVALKRRA